MENALAHTTFFSSPLHFVSLPKQNPSVTAYPIPPDPIPFTWTLQAATDVNLQSTCCPLTWLSIPGKPKFHLIES
jgi:hypothetical protein